MTTATQQRPLSQAERYQDWGVDHPIPELDAALEQLNEYRPRIIYAAGVRWYERQARFLRKAARMLGVAADADATIDALTLYRSDWRGYTITNAAGQLV